MIVTKHFAQPNPCGTCDFFVGATGLLLVLSMYKRWGLTAYGRRMMKLDATMSPRSYI